MQSMEPYIWLQVKLTQIFKLKTSSKCPSLSRFSRAGWTDSEVQFELLSVCVYKTKNYIKASETNLSHFTSKASVASFFKVGDKELYLQTKQMSDNPEPL